MVLSEVLNLADFVIVCADHWVWGMGEVGCQRGVGVSVTGPKLPR